MVTGKGGEDFQCGTHEEDRVTTLPNPVWQKQIKFFRHHNITSSGLAQIETHPKKKRGHFCNWHYLIIIGIVIKNSHIINVLVL